MTCKFIKDENGNVSMVICSTPWGIGSVTYHGQRDETVYGFPHSGMDPHDFYPDYECCTKEEIAAWEKACNECKCGGRK